MAHHIWYATCSLKAATQTDIHHRKHPTPVKKTVPPPAATISLTVPTRAYEPNPHRTNTVNQPHIPARLESRNTQLLDKALPLSNLLDICTCTKHSVAWSLTVFAGLQLMPAYVWPLSGWPKEYRSTCRTDQCRCVHRLFYRPGPTPRPQAFRDHLLHLWWFMSSAAV